MRKFIVFLLLVMIMSSVGWELVGIIPNDFFETNKDPKAKRFIIEMLIENVKIIHPHCRGAYIKFVDSEEDKTLSNIYAKCYKWEI